MELAMIGPTQSTSFQPIPTRGGTDSTRGRALTSSFTDALSRLVEAGVQATSRIALAAGRSGRRRASILPLRIRATANTIIAPAASVTGEIDSPRTIAPSATATSGFTYA